MIFVAELMFLKANGKMLDKNLAKSFTSTSPLVYGAFYGQKIT